MVTNAHCEVRSAGSQARSKLQAAEWWEGVTGPRCFQPLLFLCLEHLTWWWLWSPTWVLMKTICRSYRSNTCQADDQNLSLRDESPGCPRPPWGCCSSHRLRFQHQPGEDGHILPSSPSQCPPRAFPVLLMTFLLRLLVSPLPGAGQGSTMSVIHSFDRRSCPWAWASRVAGIPDITRNKNLCNHQSWWHMLVTLAIGRLKQQGCYELKANWNHIARPCL